MGFVWVGASGGAGCEAARTRACVSASLSSVCTLFAPLPLTNSTLVAGFFASAARYGGREPRTNRRRRGGHQARWHTQRAQCCASERALPRRLAPRAARYNQRQSKTLACLDVVNPECVVADIPELRVSSLLQPAETNTSSQRDDQISGVFAADGQAGRGRRTATSGRERTAE